MRVDERKRLRSRRRRRIRKSVFGTSQRPRLSVFRSQKHIYAQIIDDMTGQTIVSASSRDKNLRGKIKDGSDVQEASAVGQLLAQQALASKIRSVAFDRGGYAYHGRIRALADGARQGGLDF